MGQCFFLDSLCDVVEFGVIMVHAINKSPWVLDLTNLFYELSATNTVNEVEYNQRHAV